MVHYDSDDVSTSSDEENFIYNEYYNEFISIRNNSFYMTDEEYESVYNYDNHSEEDRIDGKLYIGSYLPMSHFFLFQLSVSVEAFYHFPYITIQQYLSTPIQDIVVYEPIEIMKLEIDDDSYKVILKTHWIRIIQRNWKRVYKERCKVIQLRKSIVCQHQFEITGKYLYKAQYLPSLQGMLHSLQ